MKKKKGIVCFQMPEKGFLKSFDIWVRSNLFLKNYFTSEGAKFLIMFIYSQQLSVTCLKAVETVGNYSKLFFSNKQWSAVDSKKTLWETAPSEVT